MLATIEERYDSMANFLFGEGWRSGDWMEIKARYDISDEETDAICERLAVLAIKRAKIYTALSESGTRSFGSAYLKDLRISSQLRGTKSVMRIYTIYGDTES